MTDYLNPFDYESAADLDARVLIDYYSEDFNYSRFVLSHRNVFFAGERGTGKTMVLRFYSLPVQQCKAQLERREGPLNIVGVYVGCNTPLASKKEHELLEPSWAAVVAEHLLVLQMIWALAASLSEVPDLLEGADLPRVTRQVELGLGFKVPRGVPLLLALRDIAQHESTRTQRALDSRDPSGSYANALSFSTGIVPLLQAFREVPRLAASHFSFLFDDAHMLNAPQRRALNSWVSYRDHSLFSLKVAFARSDWTSFETATGSPILEGHDYITVDMEQPYQNEFSLFGKLAREIITKRLARLGKGDVAVDAFFPENQEFRKDIDACRRQAAEAVRAKRGEISKKQLNDYVYKHARAIYFRERSARANRPPYSGFETMVHLSTGVIRYLLEPCYRMYERAFSELSVAVPDGPASVDFISPSVQTEVIMDMSARWWDRLRSGLDDTVKGCSREQGQQLHSLLDQLAVLFRERLMSDISEPRATAFSISEADDPHMDELRRLLLIARKAQYLYMYSGVAKTEGRREYYYVPNRMLWPARGLDPIGQNARVSLRASELWAAATAGKRLREKGAAHNQGEGLFDED